MTIYIYMYSYISIHIYISIYAYIYILHIIYKSFRSCGKSSHMQTMHRQSASHHLYNITRMRCIVNVATMAVLSGVRLKHNNTFVIDMFLLFRLLELNTHYFVNICLVFQIPKLNKPYFVNMDHAFSASRTKKILCCK